VDEVQGGSGVGGPGAVYQDASVGDKHIFFTDGQQLTADSTGAGDLYEYAFDPASDTGSVVDMSVPVPAHAGEAADVEGVLGVAEDGSLVYAVARGVLSEEANMEGAVARAGEDNLYLFERVGGAWRAKFIATLSSEDKDDWNRHVGLASARVSPDGRWLAFMSDRSLTGYDNRDRVSGVPDEEAFLFDAGTGRLVCASCNPTGARPAGMEIPNVGTGSAPLIDSEQQWETGQWLAGVLPVSYGIGLEGTLGVYQPRYLSDGGRLFFDSTEALVPQDTDGTVDVYEYEPPQNGESAASDDCSESSATFSAAAEGCIDLVSGGDSSSESVFVDASENGDDVFFETAAKLAGSDVDTAYDVYDAHSCGVGASWTCPAAPAEGVVSCESAGTCKAGVASSGGGVDVLASEALEGLGNLTKPPAESKKQPKKKPAACARGKRRRKGKCVKAKAKSSSKRKRRRVHARKAGSRGQRGGR
jgi:WD40-like Beta Propeller Repeat